jgi:hypothetical protein
VSKNILPYIPQANSGPYFVSSGAASRLRDDKGSGRLDATTGIGMVSGYYYYDKYYSRNLNPTAPLFGGGSTVGSDVVNLGLTRSFGSSAVNEARIAYTRLNIFNHPTGGEPHGLNFLASLGFPVGPGALGPYPVQSAWATVPSLGFNTFSIGSGGGVGGIVEGTYQGLDNFSKVVGTHTVKLGGMLRFNQQTQYNWGSNGAYTFNGAETGIDFADYLIGAPVGFQQGQGFPDYGRNHYAGLYVQDSWRARPNLTLNYGLRWEVDTPWSELHNEIQTLVPGEQSQVYPGSPTGWVFPGDPGIPKGLGPVRYNNFSPRLGLAYSPTFDSGFLGKLTGGPGKTSIRGDSGAFSPRLKAPPTLTPSAMLRSDTTTVAPYPRSSPRLTSTGGLGLSRARSFPVRRRLSMPPLSIRTTASIGRSSRRSAVRRASTTRMMCPMPRTTSFLSSGN